MQAAPKEPRADPLSGGAPDPAASGAASPGEAASGASNAPGGQSKSADDDAMQRLMESVQKDAPKKP